MWKHPSFFYCLTIHFSICFSIEFCKKKNHRMSIFQARIHDYRKWLTTFQVEKHPFEDGSKLFFYPLHLIYTFVPKSQGWGQYDYNMCKGACHLSVYLYIYLSMPIYLSIYIHISERLGWQCHQDGYPAQTSIMSTTTYTHGNLILESQNRKQYDVPVLESQDRKQYDVPISESQDRKQYDVPVLESQDRKQYDVPVLESQDRKQYDVPVLESQNRK